MVYGTYNYSYWGEYKPTNITGGPHIATNIWTMFMWNPKVRSFNDYCIRGASMLVKKQGHKEFQWLTNLGCLDTPLGMVVASSNQALQFKVTHLWIIATIATPKKVESQVPSRFFKIMVNYFSVSFPGVLSLPLELRILQHCSADSNQIQGHWRDG